MIHCAIRLAKDIGVAASCKALVLPRATFYRHSSRCNQAAGGCCAPRIAPLALTQKERQAVLDVLCSEQFIDHAPHQVYAKMLDQGQYLCSIRTMYRLLEKEHGAVKERRRQVKRPAYSKPELLATGPNQVWSWDITKLKSSIKYCYFYLYVIIDIFSRYVVGWMVCHAEQASLAKRLIEQSCLNQDIAPDQLILHADRGSSMKSKAVAELLVDLGVIKTHSRPHVSNDNPYSEAQFKTLKYCPAFPETFGCIQDAKAFCREFFTWYNKEHCHTGIGLMTPEKVHYGLAQQVYQDRSEVLRKAFENHPHRFKGRCAKPPALPKAAWINKPKNEDQTLELNLPEAVSHFH
ncbi:MAG: IS3 family transposase [Desulfobacteraceae bacterium]|nr:MAG: IS3 family transposase [Desulfobacteraceae bacterium]